MNPSDLVRAAMRGDDLAARQWVKDALHAGVDFSALEQPQDLDDDEMAIAAALLALLAQRQGRRPPTWAMAVPASARPVFLSRKALTSRVVRQWCETGAPEPLRSRNVFALPDYLAVVGG